MKPGIKHLNNIFHKGDQKDLSPDQPLNFGTEGHGNWLVEGSAQQLTSADKSIEPREAAKVGDITNTALAYWVAKDYIVWDVNLDPNTEVSLYFDPDGQIFHTETGITSGRTIPLLFAEKTLPPQSAFKFPHLQGMQVFKITNEYLELVPDILRGQVVIASKGLDRSSQGATALQIPGVLDDLYAKAAWGEALGVEFEMETPILKVWAPTAKTVNLLIYEGSSTPEVEKFPMDWDSSTGIWSIQGYPGWKNNYYLFDVEVFIRQQGTFVHNLVTDPYSLSLSANSTRSQIVDLSDPTLIPEGWDSSLKPELDSFTDIILYELHLRDFSAIDETVPKEQQGTYLAFTNPESHGMQHLSGLTDAGLTHVHLLPSFDIATINEIKGEWESVGFEELHTYPSDSDIQQSIANLVRGKGPFNWGYDPFHYTVPEGSYSTDPDGNTRILEFRKMVKVLNSAGLLVVMDVVYNHTNASGQNEKSVLDRIVPGYYHRLDNKGEVTISTCCANTATEHDMMRKLMIDSVMTWAGAYKVDGFRFDLMGHHMVKDMMALREALDSLTLETDGVDGEKIYIYGEGWDFGEVADNARGLNATQVNMAGTGIGTFNDRVRDAVRGGTPFSSKQDQGFATGMFFDPNEANTLSETEQLETLLIQKDHIRVTLAGNLADYEFIGAEGDLITGAEVLYAGSPAGYTISPDENVIYISAHDNETLFDAIQYKMPATASLEERVEAQHLSLSVVAFSQGVPFFHAGCEMLRSKSMDRDSYDSTDWFNALDWTYNDNGWGHGLPLKDKNGTEWPFIQPLLANPKIAPSQVEILQSLERFKQWLRIRSSSPLFRLQTAEQIHHQVRFHNTGPDQFPGMIVMSISDDLENPIDLNYDMVFLIWNAAPRAAIWKITDFDPGELFLHPYLTDAHNSQAEYNPATKSFSLPGRSVAVFVSETPLTKSNPEDISKPEMVESTP